MSNKWKYIFGATTITVIVGGTVYAIVKSNRMKKLEEEAITVAEAREIVAEREGQEPEETEETVKFNMVDLVVNGNDKDIEEVVEKQIKAIKVTKASEYSEEEEIEELLEEVDVDINDPLFDAYPHINEKTEDYSVEPLVDFFYHEEGINPKEDKTLRYDPNSTQAKHQFIRMELADWEPNHDIYRIMIQLFEYPFIPTNPGDEMLRTKIIDYKVQFFGFDSRWNKEVSYADIILYYARNAQFNCGETVAYWVEYFIDHTDLAWNSTEKQIEIQLLRLNSHTYFNEERQTFGLFGLSRDAMDQAITIANRNLDRSVTYDIEFQEFLKSCF